MKSLSHDRPACDSEATGKSPPVGLNVALFLANAAAFVAVVATPLCGAAQLLRLVTALA